MRTDPEPIAIFVAPPSECSVSAPNFGRPHLPLTREPERWMVGILAKQPELFIREPPHRLGKTLVAFPEGGKGEGLNRVYPRGLKSPLSIVASTSSSSFMPRPPAEKSSVIS